MARAAARPAAESDTAASGTRSVSAVALVGKPVVLGRIRLGFVRDVLFGADLGVVLGFVVETDAGRRCFLPWAGATVTGGTVAVSSPSLLLGDVELEYYLASGIRLADVLDVGVGPDDRAGSVADLTAAVDGTVLDLVLSTRARRRQTVAVGDVRVHWSAGQAPRLSFGGVSRRDARPGGLALAVAGRGRVG